MRVQQRFRIHHSMGRLAARLFACSMAFLLAAAVLTVPATSSAQVSVGISVTIAPPALPVYVQPPCPAPGFIWTPGYWAWDPVVAFYWVPGTWVLAPFIGALWTPGYWGWNDGLFVWYEGYWGPVVGFYGGINYGFGYTGYGYQGGYWNRGAFYYNRAANNVRVTNITTVYNRPVTSRVTARRVSYNGGRGGTTLRPTAAQLTAARQRSSPPIAIQRQQEQTARSDPRQQAAVNRGRPAVAATPKPGAFTGHGVVPARRAGAPYTAAPPSSPARPGSPARPSPPAHPGATAPTPKPEGVERRGPTSPTEHAAPPVRAVPPASPRTEPARPAYRQNEPRPAPPGPSIAPRAVPERPGTVRPPSAPQAAPRRPEVPQPPPMGGSRREEGPPR